MQTIPFCAGDMRQAKVLVIGHDPRLRESDTLATYAFFADCFFRAVPTSSSEAAKYRLARAVFSYIGHLTSYKYSADQLILTNLCNTPLPHAPKRKTVLIPQQQAEAGMGAVYGILGDSTVRLIFAMSAQVNYWLQNLGFYPAVPDFLDAAKPNPKGISHEPPYYEPTRTGAFQSICGRSYAAAGNRSVYPVLHVRNWPLEGPFERAYASAYENCINELKGLFGTPRA